mgnify:CR=1 FL=1
MRPNFRPKFKKGRQLTKSSSKKLPTKAMYGENWEELSQYVKKRDNYTCQAEKLGLSKCRVRFAPPFSNLLHAHHIIPLPKGPNHPKNIITLCVSCHSKIHNRYLGSYTDKQKKAAKYV